MSRVIRTAAWKIPDTGRLSGHHLLFEPQLKGRFERETRERAGQRGPRLDVCSTNCAMRLKLPRLPDYLICFTRCRGQ